MGRELGAGMCTAKEVNMDKIGYKAFNPGMIYRGKQYEENAVFEELEAKICNTGMHYCKNPFDVLEHYGFVNDSAATNTGDWSAATNTGDWSAATNTGKDGVAVSWGRRGKARGEKGCYLVLAEYDDSNNLVCAKMEKVDGERIKENTFYTLKNGEFAVAEEQGAEK